MDVGTVVDGLLEVRLTTWPPVGAASFSVIVPEVEAPPTNEVGLSVTLETPGVVIASEVVSGVPFAVAVSVVVVFAATGSVVTVKVPVVLPLVIVTVEGTVAAAVLLDVKLTVTPAVGAGSFNVTVPVAVVPPGTLAGLTPMLLTS